LHVSVEKNELRWEEFIRSRKMKKIETHAPHREEASVQAVESSRELPEEASLAK
jgi:hypothetical protein